MNRRRVRVQVTSLTVGLVVVFALWWALVILTFKFGRIGVIAYVITVFLGVAAIVGRERRKARNRNWHETR